MQLSELLTFSRAFLGRTHNLKRSDILSLREVVKEHNHLYYESESPIISDTEYDILFHALARLEADHDMLDRDSPTAKLAILASAQFQKVAHRYPMISLDNTYSVEEVREWNARTLRVLSKGEQNPPIPLSQGGIGTIKSSNIPMFQYYIQPKYDGLGLAVIYEYGVFTQAITRGSGVEGEDVTLTAFEIADIPKNILALRNTERMEIRGEVMMGRTEFDRVNRERSEIGEKLFANPRNCASGSLRQLDPLVTRNRGLRFFAYSIPQIEQGMDPVMSTESSVPVMTTRHLAFSEIEQDFSTTKITDIDFFRSKGHKLTYEGLMDLLASWGFERVDFSFRLVRGIDDLTKILERETRECREYFDFDIDGMVLKLDDMTLWDDLGRTEHHPRYAIAYKFPAKQVRTRVISIEHSVGRTGTVTPVANLEAVEVGGVVVRRATLHNYDELVKKGVRIGDHVFIMRAGEVIPEIVSVLTELRDGTQKIVEIPKQCPICSTPTMQDEGKVAIYCPNIHCPAKIQGQLEMFVSKQGLNIDGFGVKQIELFLELGWITDFSSVFELADHRDSMLTLEGYKEKSIENLIAALEKAKYTTLDRVFVALGIPNVGKKTARSLASVIAKNEVIQVSENTEYGLLSSFAVLRRTGRASQGRDKNTLAMTETQRRLLDTIFSITETELLEARDIGPETARSFALYMQENREIVERLFSKLEIQILNLPNPLSQGGIGTSEITGKSFCVTGSFDGISRDEIHTMIEEQSGEVRSAVTGKLDYLIVGSDAGSKKTKAESLGVKCIEIEELRLMLDQK